MSQNHKILYTSIALSVTFIVLIYSIDYFINTYKPEWIKTNGKIDRNKQFLFTLCISFIVFILFIFLMYQILA